MSSQERGSFSDHARPRSAAVVWYPKNLQCDHGEDTSMLLRGEERI